MLLDAFKSEAYRLSKNRIALFWGVGFVPFVMLIGGSFTAYFVINKSRQMKTSIETAATSDLAAPLVALSGQLANVATIAFLLIAASTLFAGDYRWETWRLISARNSRPNLMAGKLLTMLGLVVVSSLLFLLSGLLLLVIAGLFEGQPMTLAMSAEQGRHLVLFSALGMARIIQVVVLALLAATVTRSLMAALFVPIALSIAQSMAQNFLVFASIMPTDWQAIFFSPGLAFSHIKTAIQWGLPPELADRVLALSLTSLGLWIAVPLIASFILFQRQGMSKE